MDYRVEQLASAAGVRVDTVRFYQTRDLLPAPARVGRAAIYGDAHLEQLRRIRSLQQQGFSLAQIGRVMGERGRAAPEPLLAALMQKSVGGRTLTRAELAIEAGVPEALIRAAESASLIEAVRVDGEERFGEADVEMARAGFALLDAGFPLQNLLAQAVAHSRNVQEVCDAAIDLFDDHVRKRGPAADDPAAIATVFQQLLPQVTRLVALHFQRTLVSRAINRLRSKKDSEDLAAALAATDSARLEVEVAWR